MAKAVRISRPIGSFSLVRLGPKAPLNLGGEFAPAGDRVKGALCAPRSGEAKGLVLDPAARRSSNLAKDFRASRHHE
jgi:hypothetical protein